MSKQDVQDLMKFMMPYSGEVQNMALWLRSFVWDLYPETNELIYDNYNAVAFGWSPSDRAGDVFCSIAVCSDHVNFGFNWGVLLHDSENILLGNGSQYRYIRVKEQKDFPEDYIKILLQQAYENSMAKLKPNSKPLIGQTITKSISPVKKRPKMN